LHDFQGPPLQTFYAVAGMLLLFIIGMAGGIIAFGGSATTTGTRTMTTTITATGQQAGGTVTETITQLGMGSRLAALNGSGNVDSPPFTATSTQVLVNMTLQTTVPTEALFSWFIYPQNSTVYTANGSVNGQTGAQSSYAYGLIAGQDYYIAVVSANYNWALSVTVAK
jgi:hypothetical protein